MGYTTRFIITFLAIASFLFAGSLLSEEGPPRLPGYFPIEVINQTQITTNQDIYITVKGSDLKTGDSCFIQFDENGIGTCQAVSDKTNVLDFVYKLSFFKGKDLDSSYLYLPYLASGRIYLSVGEPMRFQISTKDNKSLIIDPDGFKPRDPNYYTLYDKVEFSYIPPNKRGEGGGTWMNPTAVDFFSLPLSIEQSGSTVFGKTGISLGRDITFNMIKGVFMSQDRTPTEEWSKLFLLYLNKNNDEIILRLMAPGKAMIQGVPGTKPMDAKLLNDENKFGFNFTDALWNYYRTNTLIIDTSELRGAGTRFNNYLFKGKVKGNNFIFTNGEEQVVLPKPTRSVPWFAGAMDGFDAKNNTPKAIIVRQLTSAFEVGLLPAPDGTVLDRSYFDEQRVSGRYYTENSLLEQTKTGPWYDLYSLGLHQFGEEQPIYSFAYDDALGQDGTLHDPNPLDTSPAIITIGDMSDTIIPRPFQDENKYSVRVAIGSKSTVMYQGRPLSQGETLSNITVPMQVQLNGKEAEIYFDPAIVLSKSDQADGIVIQKQEGNAVQLIFPGS